ncbi:hypothetical protein IHQ56_09635 [Methylobacillus flagellatus]|uniref:hypothetical protein n=1 Tax=Methylobacillus TaxID=404 RepID=UPI002853A233|nr:hypothetical protein [Methylobacillus flagellatus]MDR5172078.1 hypothetical protein [Methylobacillus flagellatus]
MNKRFTDIWGWPILLAVLTTLGLLSALLGVGIWHWLAWASLAVPIIVIWHYWLRPKR